MRFLNKLMDEHFTAFTGKLFQLLILYASYIELSYDYIISAWLSSYNSTCAMSYFWLEPLGILTQLHHAV